MAAAWGGLVDRALGGDLARGDPGHIVFALADVLGPFDRFGLRVVVIHDPAPPQNSEPMASKL